MRSTLKEILNPPFSHDHCEVGHIICGVNKVGFKQSRLLDTRGWGFFQNFENGEQLQDEFKDFVVQALNEKWERDFGEPLRWIVVWIDDRRYLRCPKCDDEHYMGNDIKNNNALIRGWKHCPRCGQQLLPPEEAQE